MPTIQKNIHSGHRERLIKKLMSSKNSDLVQHELLEALLFYAIPRSDTNPLAHRLINVFGSIERVLCANETELKNVKGVGPKTADYIRLLGKLVYNCQTICGDKISYDIEKRAVRDYIRALFTAIDREQVHVLFLDSLGRVVSKQLMFEGTFENVDINLKDVLRAAVEHEAAGVVCAHNHPSGIAKPSYADRKATVKLRDSFNMIGVNLIDHLVVTQNAVYGIITNYYIEETENM